LTHSAVKEAKLYTASKKAAVKPDTGIVIQNQSAYHVIKDCAKITYNYLPIYVFGQYQDPFDALKGAFTKRDIEEFIVSANSNFINHQLLVLILNEIKKSNLATPEVKKKTVISEPISDDPYGDYGYSDIETEPTQEASNQDTPIVDILCQAFGVSDK
jgi:hypothetical protein